MAICRRWDCVWRLILERNRGRKHKYKRTLGGPGIRGRDGREEEGVSVVGPCDRQTQRQRSLGFVASERASGSAQGDRQRATNSFVLSSLTVGAINCAASASQEIRSPPSDLQCGIRRSPLAVCREPGLGVSTSAIIVAVVVDWQPTGSRGRTGPGVGFGLNVWNRMRAGFERTVESEDEGQEGIW